MKDFASINGVSTCQLLFESVFSVVPGPPREAEGSIPCVCLFAWLQCVSPLWVFVCSLGYIVCVYSVFLFVWKTTVDWRWPLMEEQAQLGVPHSRIQIELDFILQAGAQNYRGGGHRTYILDEWNKWGGDTAQLWKKAYTGRGGHRTYFLGVGTSYISERKSLAVRGGQR